MTSPTYDAAVVGGGPAGAFTAGCLARRGRSVLLLERERFPRFHIGESMLPQSLEVLAAEGALETIAGFGFTRKNGAAFLSHDGRRSARFDFGRGEPASAYPYAFQVERARFDDLLLRWAERQGAEVREGVQVAGAELRDVHGLARLRADGQEHAARFVVDACGLDSVAGRVRGWNAEPLVKDRAALFGHFRLARDFLAGVPEAVPGDILIVARGDAWGWMIPLEPERTSVGFVVPIAELNALEPAEPEARFRELMRTMPVVADRLRDAEWLGAIRGARAYGRANGRLHDRGLVLAGDAAGFLDPVFSSGLCVALRTSQALAVALDRALRVPAEEEDALADYVAVVRRAFRSMGPFVERWYEGSLQRLIFQEDKPERIRANITSILAGELWREENPIVRSGERWLDTLSRLSADPSAS